MTDESELYNILKEINSEAENKHVDIDRMYNAYKNNAEFREWVNRHCKAKNKGVFEVLRLAITDEVLKYYESVQER